MEIKIKVLKKGDKVNSVFPYGEGFAIAIERKNGDVDVVLIEKGADGAPRVGNKILIREGDDIVEAHAGQAKVMTF